MKLIQIQKQNAMKQSLLKKIQVKVNLVILFVIKNQNLLKIYQMEVNHLTLIIMKMSVNKMKINLNLYNMKINHVMMKHNIKKKIL